MWLLGCLASVLAIWVFSDRAMLKMRGAPGPSVPRTLRPALPGVNGAGDSKAASLVRITPRRPRTGRFSRR